MGIKTLVVGIGNILMEDDGIAIELCRYLHKMDIPYTKILEAGTENWRIFSELDGFDRLIIVDAVNCGYKPGTVALFKDFEVLNTHPVSLHDKSFLSDIFIYKKLKGKPKQIYLFGIEPYKVDWHIGISPNLKSKFFSIAEKLEKTITGEKNGLQ